VIPALWKRGLVHIRGALVIPPARDSLAFLAAFVGKLSAWVLQDALSTFSQGGRGDRQQASFHPLFPRACSQCFLHAWDFHLRLSHPSDEAFPICSERSYGSESNSAFRINPSVMSIKSLDSPDQSCKVTSGPSAVFILYCQFYPTPKHSVTARLSGC